MLSEDTSDAFAPTDDAPKRGRGRPKKDQSERVDTDKPPKRPTQPAPIKGWTRAAEVEKVIYTYLTTIAAGVAFVNIDDAQAISNGAARLASELVELGKMDKKYRGYLEMLTKPGKYGGVLIATGAIVLPIAINHNLIPQLRIPFGTPDGDYAEGAN